MNLDEFVGLYIISGNNRPDLYFRSGCNVNAYYRRICNGGMIRIPKHWRSSHYCHYPKSNPKEIKRFKSLKFYM